MYKPLSNKCKCIKTSRKVHYYYWWHLVNIDVETNLFLCVSVSLYKERFVSAYVSKIRQLLKWFPLIPAKWYSGVCVNSCPWAWAGPNGLPMTRGIWQKWKEASEIRLHRPVISIFLVLSFALIGSRWGSQLSSCDSSLGEVHREWNWETEVLCPIVCEVPNPANSDLSDVGSWYFPLELGDVHSPSWHLGIMWKTMI